MSAWPPPGRRRLDATTRTLTVLVALTLASLLLMETSGGSTTAAVVMLVAFAKVALIGVRFMELDAAPAALLVAFGTWTIGTATLLAVLLHV